MMLGDELHKHLLILDENLYYVFLKNLLFDSQRYGLRYVVETLYDLLMVYWWRY